MSNEPASERERIAVLENNVARLQTDFEQVIQELKRNNKLLTRNRALITGAWLAATALIGLGQFIWDKLQG